MNNKITSLIVPVITLLCSIQSFSQSKEVELSAEYLRFFDDYKVRGSLVFYDLDNDKFVYFDKERTQKRFSPASTFKIFNSLVGLETGVIPDTSTQFSGVA